MSNYTADEVQWAKEYYDGDPEIQAVLDLGVTKQETEFGTAVVITRAAERIIDNALTEMTRGKSRKKRGGAALEGIKPSADMWAEALAGTTGRHDMVPFGGVPVMSHKTVGLIWGPSHTGKTTLMCKVTDQVVVAGGKVLWLVWDGTAGQVGGMLRKSGMQDAQIVESVAVVEQAGKLTVKDADRVAKSWGGVYDLVVFDNYNTVSRHWYPGESENSNDVPPEFLGSVCRAIANAGPCVVVLDNTGKTGTEEDLMSRGGSAKRDAVDWSRRLTPVGKGFSGESAGAVRLLNKKDRVTGWDIDKVVGVFEFDGKTFHLKAGGAASGTVDDVMAPDVKTPQGRENFVRMGWQEQDPDDEGMSAVEVKAWLRNTAQFKGLTNATRAKYIDGKTGVLIRGVENGWLLKVHDATGVARYRYLASVPPAARPDTSGLLTSPDDLAEHPWADENEDTGE